MKIKVQQCPINSIPSVIVYTTDWSKQELDAMLRFGEPEIDIGGEFDKHPCPRPPDPFVPGFIDPRLSNQVRKFFKTLAGVTSENSDTGSELQQWLLSLKDSIDFTDGEDQDEDSNDEGGGDYSETDDEFTMPSVYKKIKSGFPVMVTFTTEHFKDPQQIGKLWADEIARRIAMEVKGLRYLGTLFTKEETYEI